VIMEALKTRFNQGESAQMYFFPSFAMRQATKSIC